MHMCVCVCISIPEDHSLQRNNASIALKYIIEKYYALNIF